MTLSKEEKAVRDKAIKFAQANKKVIAKRLTDKSVFSAEDNPVSVFMAGSPGAGKTEASLSLIAKLASEYQVLRIDPDELRSEFEDYEGCNSYLFQPAVSILVEKIHDFALKNKQSFLMDGTLASYEVARRNIQRSLNKDRFVQILYVYQQPRLAWNFVQAREREEGRRILPEHFVEQYFAARETVNKLKAEYGKELWVDLLLKDIDNSNRSYVANVDKIDNHIPEKYNYESLMTLIKGQARGES